MFSIVVAVDEHMGIGKDNDLPWPRLAGDMKYFADVTSDAADGKMNAVIMGRKTWESIPAAHRPLKGRLNVVLSRGNVDLPEGVALKHSFDEALEFCKESKDVDKIYVIGGANVFKQAIHHEGCKKIFLTVVNGEFDCDVYLEELPGYFEKMSVSPAQEDNGIKYRFVVFERD